MSGLGNGTASDDAVNKGQLDGHTHSGTYVSFAGGNVPTITNAALANGFQRVNLNYTATGTTPDAFTFYYNGTRTGYFNEYGELRARPQGTNTVAFRCQAHASGSTVDVMQVTSSDNLTVYMGVSDSEAVFGVPVTAPNLPPAIESGSTLPSPTGYAEGSIFFVI